jgi:hypothetical protein
LRQLVEQRLGVLQDWRVEAFSEPATDRGEQIASMPPLSHSRSFDRPDTHGRRSRALADTLAKPGAVVIASSTRRLTGGLDRGIKIR